MNVSWIQSLLGKVRLYHNRGISALNLETGKAVYASPDEGKCDVHKLCLTEFIIMYYSVIITTLLISLMQIAYNN